MKSPAKFFGSISILALLLESVFSLYLINVPVANAANLPSFTNIKENSTNLKRYDKFELNVSFNAQYDNPFRSETNNAIFRNADKTQTGSGIALDGFFTSPSGKTMQVSGFYNVDYTKTGVSSMGDDLLAVNSAGEWLVRYTPKESGTYSYYLKLADKNGTTQSSAKQFTVSSDINPEFPHGMLVKSTKNPNFLEYEDGTPFVEFGLTGTIEDYSAFSKNGGNFNRVWLTNGSASSIFRNTLNPWQTNSSGRFSNDAHYGAGSVSYKVNATSLATGKNLISQNNIGAASSTCYAGSIWVKTGSDFSGSFYLQGAAGSKKSNSPQISNKNLDWTQISIPAFQSSSMNSIIFQVIAASTVNGTVWFDNADLHETLKDESGNCTGTPKYQTDRYSMVWDPSFESNHYNGDPSHFEMVNLARFEETIISAEQNGIIVMPCIFDHRVWGDSANSHSNWAPFFQYDIDPATGKAPYNFFTDSFSKEQVQDVLRYLIARFGYSPALGIWEIGNEMDPSNDKDRIAWVNSTVDYLHQHSTAGQLVTNSYWFNPSEDVEAALHTDVTSVHYYMNDDSRDPIKRYAEPDEYMWAIDRNQWSKNLYADMNVNQKPWISGEFGLMGDRIDNTGTKRGADLSRWDDPGNTNWRDTVTRHDTKGIFFHNAVWAGLAANAFKSSVSNWWSDPFNTWNYQTQYLAPSKFSEYVPFFDDSAKRLSTYGLNDLTPRPSGDGGVPILDGGVQVTSSNTDVRVLGREKDNKGYLWVQNKNNTWGNVIKDNHVIGNESGDITIPGFSPNASLPIRFFDTYTGEIIKNTSVTADDAGKITLSVNLTVEKPDIAIIIGNTYENPIEITQSANITDGGTTAHAGDTIKYSFNVKNFTKDLTQTVAFSDPIDPKYFNFVSADHGGISGLDATKYPGKTVITWKDITVNPGQEVLISFTVTVKSLQAPAIISDVISASKRVYKVGQLKVGTKIYTDRTYAIKTMPTELSGADGIMTANDDKSNTATNFLTFKLTKDADVYIAMDKRVTKLPAWLASWQDTGMQITTNEKVPTNYRVYRKSYDAGSVTLGGNYGTSASSMYFVMAKPAASGSLVSSVTTASNKTYLADQLKTGDVYIDRDYTIKNIDMRIPTDSYLIKTANDDKLLTTQSFLNLSLSRDADILVAYDTRASLPTWLKGWTKTNATLATNEKLGSVTFNIYSKRFFKGSVTLGANSGASTSSMYLVIINKNIVF